MATSRVEFGAGEIVFREGDPPTTAYLIESGEVEVLTMQDAEPLVLGRLGAGDLLGEMAVIDASPRTATARAVTACVMTALDGDQINERLENADPIVRALLRGQLQRYRGALARLRGASGAAVPAPRPNTDLAQSGAIGKIRLETQLKEALDNRALEVRFQPIFDLKYDRIAGYEALIRWQHPDRGAISPVEFIALAEETSLIVPVGLYVFDEVCAVLARLNEQGVEPMPYVAVNVSGRQLEQDVMLDEVRAIVARHGVPLSCVRIEITESLTLNVDRVGSLIERCHALGMYVALDDFGTGYSNLGHLHKLRFDTIKLDQGFTRQMLEAPRCLAIVQAVVAMVAALDAELVAEGVETAEQLAALRAMGCRYAQGWLIGKAQASAEMIAFQRTRESA